MEAIGNLVVEPKEKVVELRLLTFHKGHPTATYTYSEIAVLAQRLAALKPPRVEPADWEDLV
jgi:hypothetical protein